MASTLTINKDLDGTRLVLTPEGRIDTTTAAQFEESITSCADGLKELIFDFSKLDYISSAGLRVLLMAQKTMNKQGSLVIRNVNDEIAEIFEVTGFSDILTIE
ncbi:MAG: STAS domain-containing protein [Eubacteriales bacterium]|nr:STAS domain-containing protein [Eubacteriales bacterium]